MYFCEITSTNAFSEDVNKDRCKKCQLKFNKLIKTE